jgi:hypothetical protein
MSFRRSVMLSSLCILCGAFPAPAQVSMPPLNMGGTSFLDGVAGPGILFEPGVIEHYHATRFVDAKGAAIPGSNSIDTWSNLLHVAYITKHQILGGFYGAEFLLPVATVDVNTSFGPKDTQSGVGDLAVSPLIIEWPGRTLFGKTYFSRFVALAVLPTGSYDATRAVNIGSHAGGAFAYYAFTFMPQLRWETSWRIHYLWNASNSEPFIALKTPSTQAGQAVHANYAMSYEVSRALRFGVNGYYLQQLTDHRLGNVDLPHSRERVLAIGPAAQWSSGFYSVLANVDFETNVQNRPQGYRVNLTLRRVFPHMPPGPRPGGGHE